MKNVIIPIVLFISISSCNERNQNNSPSKKQIQTPLQNYFDFDEIVYYKIQIDSRKAMELIDGRNKTKQDTLLLNAILSLFIPQTITDTNFISSLETLNFRKKSINHTSYSSINEIFKEKIPAETIAETTCSPVFRDILIFKKSNNVVGLAKICFECQQNYILGTNANTFMFGQKGDYKKLETILVN
jgi:hypothetical protein